MLNSLTFPAISRQVVTLYAILDAVLVH